MSRIIVEIVGGCLEGVYADPHKDEVYLVDWDQIGDGEAPKRLTVFPWKQMDRRTYSILSPILEREGGEP